MGENTAHHTGIAARRATGPLNAPGTVLLPISAASIAQEGKTRKKNGRCLSTGHFYVRILLSGADSAVGAGICAGAAIQASASVDHVLGITLGDSAHGASVCTSATADASGTDLISHFEYLH